MYSGRLSTFQNVQDQFGDIPGDTGISLRRKHYAPHFLGFGKCVVIEQGCRFYHTDRVVLDDEVRINRECLIYGSGGVRIGRHVRMGPRCFIHSANHDINGASNLAYHEKGYVEDAVTIGDLCLLSANVSIMPGARIGVGCFVACGAVVAAGRYPENSRLLGVPARIRNQQPSNELASLSSPEIALLVEDEEPWQGFARQLVTVLGLPQLAMFVDHQAIPASCKSVLAIGSPLWRPPLSHAWSLQEGRFDHPLEGGLPIQMVLPSIPSSTGAVDALAKNVPKLALRRASFWFFNRLLKRTELLSFREWRDWDLAVEVLDRTSTSEESDVPKHLRNALQRLKPRILHRLKARCSEIFRGLRRNTQEPSYIVAAALNHKIKKTKFASLIKDPTRIPKNFTAAQLSALYVAAFLTGEQSKAELIYQQIKDRVGFIADLQIPKAKADSRQPCWSPFALATAILRAHHVDANLRNKDVFWPSEDAGRRLTWRCFDKDSFIDPKGKLVARCLVDNWIAIHSAKLPTGLQFYLTNNSYSQSPSMLEKLWLNVFRSMLSDVPLVQIKPWPAGYEAALSLRLDVDRPVSAGTIREIAGIQQHVARSPCASWFYFAKDEKMVSQQRILSRYFQEVGVHLLGCEEAKDIRGRGVTHHSGVDSAYWQGERSLVNLSGKNISYCEYLAARFRCARPLSLIGQDLHQGIWAAPIHFPLEGSSKDENLDYFSALKDYFLDQLAQGGHAIIGTHPDVNLKLLRTVMQRFASKCSVWKATISAVIERQKLLFAEGSIVTFRDRNKVFVASKNTIADVVFDLWEPGAVQPQTFAVNLIAGQPRQLAQDIRVDFTGDKHACERQV